MKQFIYYANGGSGNHGCEAIIRSLEMILTPEYKSLSLSVSSDQDHKYGINELVNTIALHSVSRNNFTYLKSYIDLRLRQLKYSLDIFPYRYVLKRLAKQKNKLLALSVGGDNYCYGGTDFYYNLDQTFHKAGIKTALVGCSIEPDIISNHTVKTDLESHSLIIARESLTYDALQENGLRNTILCPDPAFLLKTGPIDSQIDCVNKNTVGINLSPQVDKCSSDGTIITHNTDALIRYIIETSSMNIALIPHVVWPQSNDLDTLKPLYEKYKHTGRIVMIEDCNAEILKGYISRCRFLIAVRTHASIAAYSSYIPTLVIGYSVKSKGIAKDIFGTDDNYVIAAQNFKTDFDLIDRFEWLMENENTIRTHLQSFMPDYCKKAYGIKTELLKISK